MKRLTEGALDSSAAASVMQLDDDGRARRLVDSLVADGLVELVDGFYRLSSTSK
jgi:hypothetical protein